MLINDSNNKQNLTGQLISHLELSGDPFSEENSCFFEDAQRKHNIETLRHLAIFGDMVLLLTGEIGAGKTSLIERFVLQEREELNICVYKNAVPFIKNRAGADKMSRAGSVNHFSSWAKIERVEGESDSRSMTRLIDHCNLNYQSTGKRTLLILDDADLLSSEELALYLSVFKSLPVESGVVLLLAGTPKLLKFAYSGGEIERDEQVHQIQLKPLTNVESIDYIKCRLASVGYTDALSLTDNQKNNLAKMGKGLPGRINRFFAYIVFELGLPEAEKPNENNMVRKVLCSIAGLLLLSLILVSYQHGLLDFSGGGSGLAVLQEEKGQEHQVKAEEAQIIARQQEARLRLLNLANEEASAQVLSHDLDSEKKTETVAPVQLENDAQSEVSVSETVQVVEESDLRLPVVNEQKAHTNLSSVSQVEVEVVLSDVQKVERVESKVIVGDESRANAPIKPKSFRTKDWVLSKALTNYTAQLLGSYNEETAVQFIKKSGVLDLYYLKTLYKGKAWYVVFYGDFPSKKAAQKAVSVAPKVVQDQGPWLRQFQGVLLSYSK